VQALKSAEQLTDVDHVEAGAVIPYIVLRHLALVRRTKFDADAGELQKRTIKQRAVGGNPAS
jgi:hypothetical protein